MNFSDAENAIKIRITQPWFGLARAGPLVRRPMLLIYAAALPARVRIVSVKTCCIQIAGRLPLKVLA